MDKLGAYIIELLQMSPLVHLVGIGTFKRDRTPAIFDKDNNTYLAPTQTIILLEKEYPDNLLINCITEKTGISPAESEEKLKHIVEAIQQEIVKNGESIIVGLGKITKKTTGGYTFIAEIQSLPLYKPVKELKLIGSSDQTSKPVDKVVESVETVAKSEVEQSANRWLWPVLLIASVVIAGSIWFLKPFNHAEDKIQIATAPHLTDTVVMIDTISSSTNAAALSVDSTKLQTNAVAAGTLVPTYEIIIVSFGKLSEAEKYVADMNAKGYKIRILENQKPGNLYKVSYSSYSTEDEANQELLRVRKDLVKDAWVLKSNH